MTWEDGREWSVDKGLEGVIVAYLIALAGIA
jgi:hypothetical protein